MSREGSSGQASINWTLAGTGTQAAQVTSDDVAEMQGTVIMQSGGSKFVPHFHRKSYIIIRVSDVFQYNTMAIKTIIAWIVLFSFPLEIVRVQILRNLNNR